MIDTENYNLLPTVNPANRSEVEQLSAMSVKLERLASTLLSVRIRLQKAQNEISIPGLSGDELSRNISDLCAVCSKIESDVRNADATGFVQVFPSEVAQSASRLINPN